MNHNDIDEAVDYFESLFSNIAETAHKSMNYRVIVGIRNALVAKGISEETADKVVASAVIDVQAEMTEAQLERLVNVFSSGLVQLYEVLMQDFKNPDVMLCRMASQFTLELN